MNLLPKVLNEQRHNQLDHLRRAAEQKEHSLNALRAQYERSGSSIYCPASHILIRFHLLEETMANLEKVVRDLRHELAAANQKQESLDETINSLHAQGKRSSSFIRCPASHVLTRFHSSEEKIANLEKVVLHLRHELATSQLAASQKEKSLNQTIDSLRAQDERSSTSDGILTSVIGIDANQTMKLYNYNKKWTTSHTLFVFTSRNPNVKLCMQKGA